MGALHYKHTMPKQPSHLPLIVRAPIIGIRAGSFVHDPVIDNRW